jgi:hypothetical protein
MKKEETIKKIDELENQLKESYVGYVEHFRDVMTLDLVDVADDKLYKYLSNPKNIEVLIDIEKVEQRDNEIDNLCHCDFYAIKYKNGSIYFIDNDSLDDQYDPIDVREILSELSNIEDEIKIRKEYLK